jgi:hypothetical protein
MIRKTLIVNLMNMLLAAALLAAGFGLVAGRWSGRAEAEPGLPAPSAPSAGSKVYLPKVYSGSPLDFRFGVEVVGSISPNTSKYARLLELNPSLVRLGGSIRWHELQPVEGGPIDWGKLSIFEENLRTLRQAGLPVLVAVKGAPDWAVAPDARDDGALTSCGPIRSEKFPAFAAFMTQLIQRYSAPEYGVHQWEMGNEPDFDPDSVAVDSVFGCWGDRDDLQYFGGQRYGEMLKAVTPAMRAADPEAVVWVGGLVLANPNSNPLDGHGIAENFMRGVLQSGAAPYFDAIGYHFHTSYWGVTADYDLMPPNWTDLGGGVVGKARFLQGILDEYGVSKPLYLNETAFGCIEDPDRCPWCVPPGGDYFTNQADYLTRTMVRGLGNGVKGQSWYSLEDPGWRYTGLLNFDFTPRPSFNAYKFLNQQIGTARFVAPVDYGPGIEAYRFLRSGNYVDVLWALENQQLVITLPGSKLLAVYNLSGSLLHVEASQTELTVGFSPVYLVHKP